MGASSPSSSQLGSATSPPIPAGDSLLSLAKAVPTAYQAAPRAGAHQGLAHPTCSPGLISVPNPPGQCCSQSPSTHGATADHQTSLHQYKPGLSTTLPSPQGREHACVFVCVCVCTVCRGTRVPAHAQACRGPAVPVPRTPCHSCSLGDRPPSSAGTSSPQPAFVPGFN